MSAGSFDRLAVGLFSAAGRVSVRAAVLAA